MSDWEFFERALKQTGYGRPYAITKPSTWPESLFVTVEEQVKGIQDRIAREAEPGALIPDMVAGVADESRFNARAFRFDGRFVVVVNYGALILMHALAHRLFSQPEFLPWVGDPTKEDAARTFAPLSNNALLYMQAVPKGAQIHPRDPRRGRAAELLTRLGVSFLVAHEVGHVIGGHIGWARHRPGTLAGSEDVSVLPEPNLALSSQALETDADGFAMRYVLEAALFLATRPVGAGDSSRARVLRTPEDAVQVSLLCGMVMIGAFFPPRPREGEWLSLSHPPAGVRLGLNIVSADRALRSMGHGELAEKTTSTRDWAGRVANLALVSIWKRIGHADRQDELKLALGPAGQRHVKAVLEEWLRIAPEVRKFAYGVVRPRRRAPT